MINLYGYDTRATELREAGGIYQNFIVLVVVRVNVAVISLSMPIAQTLPVPPD